MAHRCRAQAGHDAHKHRQLMLWPCQSSAGMSLSIIVVILADAFQHIQQYLTANLVIRIKLQQLFYD